MCTYLSAPASFIAGKFEKLTRHAAAMNNVHIAAAISQNFLCANKVFVGIGRE